MPQYNGVWTLEQQAQAQSNQQWVTDPNFRNTTLLLQADGTGSGSQNNTFLDGSTNNFYVTRNGNTTQGSFTPFSQAPGRWSTYFGASTSSYVSAPYNASQFVFSTNSFTMEFFVYFNAFVNDSKFIIQYDGSSYWQFRYDTTNGIQFVNNGTITATQGNTSGWSTNVWYHVALVRSGSTFTIYRDGVVVATGTSASAINNNSNAVTIGGNPNAGGSSQNAYMSNVRVLNGTALYSGTSTSVANFAVPNSPFTTTSGGASNCVLLTCQSNRWVDNSSFNSALTVANSPSVQAFSPFAPQFQWTPAVIGGSGYFDGTGDSLTTACASNNSAFGTADFTVEVWIYPTASASFVTPISSNYSNATAIGNWAFYFGVGSATTVYFNGGSANSGTNKASSTTTTIPLNAWTQVVYSRVSSVGRFFINGVQLGTTLTDADNYSSVAGTLYFGRMADGSNTLTGYVSDVRIIKGTGYTTYPLPTAPLTAITNTGVLLSFTNAGIYDAAMDNVLETVGNAQVNTTIVKYGSGSMAFDGTGDALAIPANAKENLRFGSADFTIEFWAWKAANGSTTYDSVISIGSTGNYIGGFNVELSETRGFCFVYDSAVRIQSIINPNDSKWHHYAVVRSNNIFALYRDGIQLTTAALTPTLGITGNAFVGAGVNSTSSNFNGYLDDLRVTRGIARYTANFIPPQVALPRQ